MLIHFLLDPWEQTSAIFLIKIYQENELENDVCQLAAMLSRPQCVNLSLPVPRWRPYDRWYRLYVYEILIERCFMRSGW